MKLPIKLGRSMKSEPMPDMPSDHYPCLYLDWDDSYDLPESGEMTVRFVKRSETNREDDRGIHQSVELDITDITDITPDKSDKKNPRDETSDVLDKYRKEVDTEDEE